MSARELEPVLGTSHFRVLIGRREVGFSQVGRVTSATDPAETPDARGHRFDTIVLRRALTGSTELYEWRRRVVEGKDERRDVTIHQLDGPGGNVANSWRLVRGRAAGPGRRSTRSRPGSRSRSWNSASRTSCGPIRKPRTKEAELAVLRDRPYAQFNFLVDLGTGQTEGPDAGFMECGPIETSVDLIEYRNGNERENAVRKVTGLNRAADVTLKRGIIGSLGLYEWLNQIRNGDQSAIRTVVIQLLSEDHTQVVQTWKLLRARIVKHVSGPLNAKATDVAMEELTLAYERLEME
jgi:phage tail-like protein